ncbi:hypothetical protein VTP01DRAFT_5609 [Rhizomucor pusillus]|uniref:uncharacterized protein n=1 Tax=Rhizomucor pusillus TaxID=4840 RepID=UPI0037443892
MKSNPSRQYSPPAPMSSLTASFYRQNSSRNGSSSAHGSALNLPDTHDLSSIKADLESILPHTEMRLQRLKEDMESLDKSLGRRDQDKTKSAGGGLVDRTRVKQEPGEDPSALHSSSKSQMDRQAALEALRRRRRREDMDSADEDTKAESPQHLAKVKRTDNASSASSRNASPPPAQRKKKASKNVNQKQNNANHDLDFVRVKPKDQVPIMTFWSALEPYFRPLTEDDRKFLLEKGDDVQPYLLPPLGRHYREVWADEDRGISPHSSSSSSSRPGSPLNRRDDAQKSEKGDIASNEPPARYLRSNVQMSEDYLLTEDLSCGSLSERLLSSLVIEDIVDADELKALIAENDVGDSEGMAVDAEDTIHKEGRTIVELSYEAPEEVVHFEERLKRELRYAGLFGDDDVDWNAREDDEICAEIRRLGRELKEQVETNEFRKKRLLEVVDQQLQYEQYRSVLDTLDAQVEQAYAKRFRVPKSKKRKSGSAPRATLSENAVSAMEKRKTWVNSLGPIFQDKNMVMPSKSIYSTDEDMESNADNTAQSQSPTSQPQQ